MIEARVWTAMRDEAAATSAREPALAARLAGAVLDHTGFAAALGWRIDTGLGGSAALGPDLAAVLHETLSATPAIAEDALLDLARIAGRDPAFTGFLQIFLGFKGYLAVQAARVAHHLWRAGRSDVAALFHARIIEATGVSIDPSARIGVGVFFDHGSGIVIGPGTQVGDDTTILQNVAIGRETGDPPCGPRIGRGCFVGSDAVVTGPIEIGAEAKIGAGAVVDRDVPPGCTAVGAPMRLVNCGAP